MHVHTHGCPCMPPCTCEGPWILSESRFSPSTMWFPGIKFWSSGIEAKTLPMKPSRWLMINNTLKQPTVCPSKGPSSGYKISHVLVGILPLDSNGCEDGAKSSWSVTLPSETHVDSEGCSLQCGGQRRCWGERKQPGSPQRYGINNWQQMKSGS